MNIKEISLGLGLIGTIIVGWLFVDGRYFHKDEAKGLQHQIIFKDTARQIDITELKIKEKTRKPSLTTDDNAELDSLRVQQKILMEQLQDLEKK